MNPSLDPYDELAALFLTESDAPLRAGSGRRVLTEIMLVGHLPVRAGVWIAPYADAVARDAGPTALLRLDDVEPHLQVLRGGDPPDGKLSLRQAVATLRETVSTWIVRPAPGGSMADIVGCGVDRVTLLTGADEAALVAAYQTIKQLAAAADEADATLPAVGVAMMGSDESTARSAVKRLNQTTHSFMGVEISLVLCLPRMDAGMISTGYRRFVGERSPAPVDVIRWITETAAPRRGDARGVDAPTPEVHVVPRDARAVPSPPPREADDDAPMDAAVRGSRPADQTPPNDEAPRTPPRTMRLGPKATIDIEPKHPATPREPDENGRPVPLAAHVEGLTPLPVRSPNNEDVELAVEKDGRLHLLGRETALRRIPVVRRWVVEHRELIAMACPDVGVDLRRPPVVHVMTDAPVSVADLHATDFRLHVLTPVKVGDQVGWYCAPLNRG